MRPLNLAISCSFACLVFFGSAAPGNYDPHSRNVFSDPGVIPPLESHTVPATEDAKPSKSENNSNAEAPADIPANEISIPKKLTSLERAKLALAETDATALSDQDLCTT